MAVAYSIAFVAYVAVVETLRNGVFGLALDDVMVIGHALLLVAAIGFLRGDLRWLISRPRAALYGVLGLGWTPLHTMRALVLAPLLLVVPLAYGVLTGEVSLGAPRMPDDPAMFAQVLAVSVVLNLFFREAALKCFAGHVPALVLASGLASFVFFLPQGPWVALIGAGSGIYYLALRLAGGNIFAIALAQTGITLIGPQLFLLPDGAEFARYAIWFTVAAIAMSLVVISTLAPKQSELRYA